MPLQIDLRSNYERKTDGIGHLIKHAEVVRMRKAAPALQVGLCNASMLRALSYVCERLPGSELQAQCLSMMACIPSIY